MNRKLKFRCWNGEQMVSPDSIDRNGFAWWKEDSIPTRTDMVMQFTGLKDKNGKEIYEGDVCRDENGFIGIVKFRNDVTAFVFEDLGGGWNSTEEIQQVIGNIYEHPNLIN